MTDDLKPARRKYGWTHSEQALHKVVRGLAEDLAECTLFGGGTFGSADEIERTIHENLQQARHDQDTTQT